MDPHSRMTGRWRQSKSHGIQWIQRNAQWTWMRCWNALHLYRGSGEAAVVPSNFDMPCIFNTFCNSTRLENMKEKNRPRDFLSRLWFQRTIGMVKESAGARHLDGVSWYLSVLLPEAIWPQSFGVETRWRACYVEVFIAMFWSLYMTASVLGALRIQGHLLFLRSFGGWFWCGAVFHEPCKVRKSCKMLVRLWPISWMRKCGLNFHMSRQMHGTVPRA